MDDDKRPRQYAAEIRKLATFEERSAALEKVPAHLREQTRVHLVCTAQAVKRRQRMIRP